MSEMFDRLAKMAAGGLSRRDALKVLGGFLAGGFLATLSGKARAKGTKKQINHIITGICKKYCDQCPSKPKGVLGLCMSNCKQFLLKNPTATACGACTATNPFSSCPPGFTCCPDALAAAAYCADLATDSFNCGACGHLCFGEGCSGGLCP